eukprot:CFRG6657T1
MKYAVAALVLAFLLLDVIISQRISNNRLLKGTSFGAAAGNGNVSSMENEHVAPMRAKVSDSDALTKKTTIIPYKSSPTSVQAKVVQIWEINSQSMDWVEIFNPTDDTVDLTGYRLVRNNEFSKAYVFSGKCGKIAASEYMLLVDEDATNQEYEKGDCKIPFGIKTSGHLALYDNSNSLLDSTSWNNVAYITGHSWARKDTNVWETTSRSTPFGPNVFDEEITMPLSVNLSNGLKDRELAYVQDTPELSITNVHLRVYTQPDECTCDKYPEAHQMQKCHCTWQDLQEDVYVNDTWEPTIPCAVAIHVDGTPEFGYNGNEMKTTQNCKVKVRGGFTRASAIKSYSIKFDKTYVPSDWRGYTRLTMVKTPWDFAGITAQLVFNQFREMEDFISLKTTVANLTVHLVNPLTDTVVDVQNMGRYILFEYPDENMLDRHGLSARNAKGDRQEAHLYKLRALDFSYQAIYDDMAPTVDPANETQMQMYEYRLEHKDSDDNTKLQTTLRELNDRVANISFVEAVHKRFDMKNLAQWVAVNLVCGDSDKMGKNQYIYSSSETDKWYFTPWDYDGCSRVVMDQGQPSLSIHRYQEYYLFHGIMFYEELRGEFYPLLKEKIRYIRQTGFRREHLVERAKVLADWVREFAVEGNVDYDLLGTRQWDMVPNLDTQFNSEHIQYDISPEMNFFGQFDFVQENLDIYTGKDYPPNLYMSLLWFKANDNKEIKVMIPSLVSPVGNEIDVYVQVYKNRPNVDADYQDLPDGIGLFDLQFWFPPNDDTIYEKKAGARRAVSHTEYEEMFLDCSEVMECENESEGCWMTVYTEDTVTGIRSAGAYIGYHNIFNNMGCTTEEVKDDNVENR